MLSHTVCRLLLTLPQYLHFNLSIPIIEQLFIVSRYIRIVNYNVTLINGLHTPYFFLIFYDPTTRYGPLNYFMHTYSSLI